MKLLIYGFESFGQDSTNVSQEVVNRLPIRQNMAKMILPVRFNASIILSNVKEYKPDDNSLVSHDAGRYFCNYSMYILLTNPKTKDIPFAFLHIPKNFDLKEAVEFVENKVEKILT